MINKLELVVLTALFLTPGIVILYHCAADPSLFAAHPAANTIAHLILSPLAIYLMIQRISIDDIATRLTLAKIHFALQVLAFVLMAAGGVTVSINKHNMDKPHFKSTHSWVAVVFGTLWSLNLFFGIALTFRGTTKINWTWQNTGHRHLGTLGFLGCGVTSIFGLFSGHWAKTKLGSDMRIVVTVLVSVAYVGLLIKPHVAAFEKRRQLPEQTPLREQMLA